MIVLTATERPKSLANGLPVKLEKETYMIATVNRQVLLKSRPKGIPESEHFQIVESVPPTPAGNQVLVRNLYLSVEPAMRAWVSAVKNYSEPVPIGGVLRPFAVPPVEAPPHPDHPGGHPLTGPLRLPDQARRETHPTPPEQRTPR